MLTDNGNNSMISKRCSNDSNDNESNIKENIENT